MLQKQKFVIGIVLLAVGLVLIVVQILPEPAPPAPPPPPSAAEREAARQKGREKALAAFEARHQKREQAWAAEEAALDSVLKQQNRWRMLPAFIRSVYIDPLGRTWFHADGGDEENQAYRERVLKQTIEQMHAGRGKILRGGKLVLVDRSNRFWAIGPRINTLLCYDGRTWTERLSTGEATPQHYGMEFYRDGWQDAGGNVYFIGGDLGRVGVGIHRFSTAGQWSFDVVVQPKDRKHFLLSSGVFVDQPEGQVTIAPALSDAYAGIALHFDGANWTSIDPRLCKVDEHSISAIVPLADGTICTICSGCMLWTYRPGMTDHEIDRPRAARLIRELAHSNARVRERATASLVEMGTPVLPLTEEAIGQQPSPEAEKRLKSIRETLLAPSSDHATAPLVGGRFRMSTCYFTSRTTSGDARFYVTDLTDTRDGRKYADAFLVLDTKQNWHLLPIDAEQWRRAGVKNGPQDVFEDAQGQIWLRNGQVITPNRELIANDAFDGQIEGEDRDGRLIIRNRGLALFDPSASEDAPGLAGVAFPVLGYAHAEGETDAWGLEPAAKVPKVLHLAVVNGKPVVKEIPIPVADAYVDNLIPVKGGVIAQVYSKFHDKDILEYAYLWDGKAWRSAADLTELARKFSGEIAERASRDFRNFSRLRIKGDSVASDGRGALWVKEHRQEGGSSVHYFDGKAWHDVDDAWRALPAEDFPPRPWEVVDAGRSMLFGCSHGLTRLTRADGQWISSVTSFRLDQPIKFQNPDGKVVQYILGHGIDASLAAQASAMATPLLVDRSQRMWFVAHGERDTDLRILTGEKLDVVSFGKLNLPDARLLETPGGRMWLFHREGLSEIAIAGTPGNLTVREVSRTSWGTPRSHFGSLFAPTDDGFWMMGNTAQAKYYQFPNSRK